LKVQFLLAFLVISILIVGLSAPAFAAAPGSASALGPGVTPQTQGPRADALPGAAAKAGAESPTIKIDITRNASKNCTFNSLIKLK
jgi:hypothetical protein